MIFSVLFFFQHIHQKSCQIIGIGRRTDLIIYNRQSVMCFAEIQHSLDKVLAIQSKHPRNTDNIIMRSILFYCNLSLIFGLSIDIQRFHNRIIRLPRAGSLTVKHIVRADIYHRNIKFSTHLCNICGSIHIYFMANLLIILSSIYCSPGSTVDDLVRLNFCHYFFYSLTVCYVHLCNINADTFITSSGQLIHYIISKLSLYACH